MTTNNDGDAPDINGNTTDPDEKWAAFDQGASPSQTETKKKSTVRVQIEITSDVARVIDQTIAALIENRSIGIYQRSHRLVRVIYDAQRPIPGMTHEEAVRFRVPGAPIIAEYSMAYLRESCSRVADFYKRHSSGKEVDCIAPDWLLAGILERRRWPFPVIEGVIESPTMAINGRIIEEPGYDEASGLLYNPGRNKFAKCPEIEKPECNGSCPPTAFALGRRIADLFCDFPFVSKTHQAAAIAALCTAILRPAIAGPVPLFAVRGTVQGSGKTLLVNAIECMRSGRMDVTIDPYTSDAEEQRKRLLTVAIDATPLVLIDNVTGTFGSHIMDAALTTGTVRDRILGKSESVALPMRTVWFLTGNNVRFRGDMGRRVLPIDLAPDCERPAESRSDFKHGQGRVFLEKIQSERLEIIPRLVASFKAYLEGENDKTYAKVNKLMGTFEDWDKKICGFVNWLGFESPKESRTEMQEFDDVERIGLEGALAALWKAFGPNKFTSLDVCNEIPGNSPFRTALAEFCPSRHGKDPTTVEIGRALNGVAGRIVNGKSILRVRVENGRGFQIRDHAAETTAENQRKTLPIEPEAQKESEAEATTFEFPPPNDGFIEEPQER